MPGGINPPPSVIASWPKPNYVNPERRDWAGPILLIIVFAVTLVVYCARLWARTKVVRNFGVDDFMISLAMIPLAGLSVASCLGIRVYGFQWHAWDQNSKSYVTTREIAYAIELLYMTSTTLIKISILCFYRRLTSGAISQVFLYWVWGAIAFVTAYGLALTFAIAFTCKPVEGYWHYFDLLWRLKNEVKCLDEGAVIVSACAISTFQDLVICALPIFLVWNLKIPAKQKAALIGIFGLGLLTCVCGIMRTYYATKVYYFTYDITWYSFYGWIWTALEADLGVICASAPALKVFFRRYFNLSSYQSTSSFGHKAWQKYRLSPWSSKHSSSKGSRNSVPLNKIKVTTGFETVNNSGPRPGSTASAGSTRGLTALPDSPTRPSPIAQWPMGSRTKITAAFRNSLPGAQARETEIIRESRPSG